MLYYRRERLQEQVDEIMTLKKIDLFEYDMCLNQYLKEDKFILSMWMQLLKVRNHLAHDYDGEIALKYFYEITTQYYGMMEEFKQKASKYYDVCTGGVTE